jgi:hypothetical protein
MPEQKTIQLARRDEREGKSPSTQAGEFVHEEIHRIRQGKHGARSPEQAIAIGLSMARRAGVKLPAPPAGKTSAETRHKAEQDLARGSRHEKPSPKRSRARVTALRHEPTSTVSHAALSKHAKKVARRRGHADLSHTAQKAALTRAHELP